jgi:hypothetical protein
MHVLRECRSATCATAALAAVARGIDVYSNPGGESTYHIPKGKVVCSVLSIQQATAAWICPDCPPTAPSLLPWLTSPTSSLPSFLPPRHPLESCLSPTHQACPHPQTCCHHSLLQCLTAPFFPNPPYSPNILACSVLTCHRVLEVVERARLLAVLDLQVAHSSLQEQRGRCQRQVLRWSARASRAPGCMT